MKEQSVCFHGKLFRFQFSYKIEFLAFLWLFWEELNTKWNKKYISPESWPWKEKIPFLVSVKMLLTCVESVYNRFSVIDHPMVYFYILRSQHAVTKALFFFRNWRAKPIQAGANELVFKAAEMFRTIFHKRWKALPEYQVKVQKLLLFPLISRTHFCMLMWRSNKWDSELCITINME